MTEKLLEEMDFSEWNQTLNQLFGSHSIDVDQMISNLLCGDLKAFWSLVKEGIEGAFTQNLVLGRNVFLAILFLGIMAAVLNLVSNMIENRQAVLFSEYFNFLLVTMVFLKSFETSSLLAQKTLESIGDFVKVLMPSFCIAMGIGSGTITAVAYYELQFFLLWMLERVMLCLFFPILKIYVMLSVFNELSDGNRMEGIISMIKKVLLWVTRVSLFVSLGGSLIQAAILPSVDQINNLFVQKTISLIPGIGNFAETFSQLFLSGGVLLKNSIGVVGILILLLIVLKPVVGTLLVGCGMKAATAIVQLAGGKKLCQHMWKMADAFFLLVRVQLFGCGIFMLSILIANIAFYKR